jgi:hypothetical protein
VAFKLQRLPETPDELYWYVRARFGVAVPRTKVCPDHVSPFQAFSDAYFAVNTLEPDSDIDSIALWHGSRGLSGKSYELSLLGLTMAELLGASVNVLGGSLAQSMNIHEHIANALDKPNAPTYMLEDTSNTKITFSNKAVIRPLTASQKTVRGPHPPRLLLDEIDEMDIKILDAALGQPMPQKNHLGIEIKPYTVMCSTWQNPQGTFTEIKRRTEERGIPVYQWCYRESANPIDGWLSETTIQEKKNSTSTIMWETEYELNEPSVGSRAFDTTKVDEAFSIEFAPIRKAEAKDFEEYTFADPLKGATYVAGADWAKEKDYTVIAVGRVDVFPHELVYYMKVNRRPYPAMVGYFNKAINRYGAKAQHDGTGLGNVVNDYVDLRADAFLMTGEKRDAMLSEYVNAVEKGRWRFPKIKSAYIAHKYAQVGDLYSRSQIFHLPDEVCAFGLMEHCASMSPDLAAPVSVGASGQLTQAQRMFQPPADRREGDVTVSRGEQSSFNMLVQ